MCQLLGMNSRLPASLTLSFTGFSQRGGCTDHHADGWGIAFFESNCNTPGKGVRYFVDKQSAATSPIAQMLRVEIEGQPLADWHRAANMLGIHLETADAIGLGPVLDLSEDPEVFEEAEITGGPDPMIVNHHTALARIADA